MRVFSGPIQGPRFARFERAALHQRIAPPAQRRNVHVDPIVPPVDRFGREVEEWSFFRWQRGGEQADVLASGAFFMCREMAARLMPDTTAFCIGIESRS